MKIIEGNLFKVNGSIGHGVNSEGLMGSGIAVTFKNDFPKLHEEYMKLCEAGALKGGDLYIYEDGDRFIYNMVTQEKAGAHSKLEFIGESASKVLEHASHNNVDTVYIPLIGSGVGGLNWHDVQRTLEQVERNRFSFFTVVKLPEDS